MLNPDVDTKNKELQTFMLLLENDAMREIPEAKYAQFIQGHIKKNNIPCKAVLNVTHMRKRIGALYTELVENQDEGVDPELGLRDPYLKKYPSHYACYGWLETDIDVRSFFLNPKIYPSWFNDNIVHFDAFIKRD